MRKTVAATLQRASVKFDLKDSGETAIENERLRTSVMVLQEKLKV